MKPSFAILSDLAHSRKSFVVKKIARSTFSTDFHFHKECQLVHIVSGSGVRIIGHSVERFEKGDLTFVGANVPHVWYSEAEAEVSEPLEAVSLALYIDSELFCEQMGGLIDVKKVQNFFNDAQRGLKIQGDKKELVISILEEMLEQKDVHLLSSFLRILVYLSDPAESTYLNAPDPISTYSIQPHGRIPKLMYYIHQNFKDDISLEQAASVSGLQIHAFCRYFKALTNRTFSEFLNDVRIGFACKLLHQSDLPITQIALECGYSNISYFNRCFKKINKMSPKEFRDSLETRNRQKL
ncbi:HTH-type transcriptional activator RhaS [Dyadobacter sp. CECT 9623]|uniref:HTH-type transcriptional activator RhaS n=1 Tax=Dyadobacter linearis TaxID=2823330 RepID=A0ABN7R5W9_9BACT|nr:MULTISPECIES: AraC family transcriptional regulator [unclassified Dyadobacter]MCE7062253.1 AraC family transcriptional regulator [Dyadobacter sp. CY343]CAG5067499.1 HTH-type transcriptional activator RhaS [Dyadobacter sp. CECT 9623]